MREHLENRIMTKRSKIKKKEKDIRGNESYQKKTENLVMQRYA